MSQEQDRIAYLLREIKSTTDFIASLDLKCMVELRYAAGASQQLAAKASALETNVRYLLEARRNVFDLPFKKHLKPKGA